MSDEGGTESTTAETVPIARRTDLPRMVAGYGVALGSLLAGGAVAYHLLVYVPDRDRGEAASGTVEVTHSAGTISSDRTLDPAIEVAELERREQLRRQTEAIQAAQRQADRRLAYQGCLNRAEQSYARSWDGQCKLVSDRNSEGFTECVTASPSIRESCRRLYPETPTQDCTLPGTTATEFNERLEAAKTRCLQEMNADLL